MSNVIYFNKSRDDIDQKCQRACYYNEVAEGSGIEQATGGYELAFGEIWHEAIAAIHSGGPLFDAITNAVGRLTAVQAFIAAEAASPLAGWDLRCKEHLYVMHGLLALYPHTKAFQAIQRDFDIVDIEREVAFTETRGDYTLTFSSKPDLLLRRRESGKLIYVEEKTTSYFTDKFWMPYKRSPQLLGATKAIHQAYGEELEYILVQPALKGSAYKDRWDSPIVYMWRDPRGTTTKWSSKRPYSWAGWEMVPAWDLEPTAWIAKLIELGVPDVVYPTAPPIYPNPAIIDTWWEQRARRRLDIQAAKERGIDEDVLTSSFPQNFSQCEPMIGRPCNYLNVCWIPHVKENPLGHGFAQKLPHSSFDPLMQVSELGNMEGT